MLDLTGDCLAAMLFAAVHPTTMVPRWDNEHAD